MEVGSPEWIEASLARLDDLERQRTEHEAAIEVAEDPAVLRQHTAALESLDAEIKSLYAQLEAVAEDDEEEDGEEQSEDEAPRVTQGDDELSSPHAAEVEPAVAAAAAAPVVETPAAADDNPFSSPSPSPGDFGGGGGFDSPAPVAAFDDDLEPKGGGSKWVFLVVVLLGAGGVGGYFAWQNMQVSKPDAPAAPVEQKVIKAAEVPDDTEAPPTAPSGQATISPNANPNNAAQGNNKKKKGDDEDKPKPLELKGGDGPL